MQHIIRLMYKTPIVHLEINKIIIQSSTANSTPETNALGFSGAKMSMPPYVMKQLNNTN